MSMIGEYMRLAPHDLDLALADPEAIRDLVDELWDLEEAGAEPDQRPIDIGSRQTARTTSSGT